MKRLWWLVTIIWNFLFGCAVAVVMTRTVDGAGVTQTPALRIISLVILGIVVIFVCACQLIWWLIMRRH
ncbi:DUF3923 family protein [Furfurilactobacillus rossiae]|uniref:DUF3923 family protein n=1 Tax=Furfurilactobacillus rossiae TaxID=231049 RepID=UPI0015BB78EC|nr:DUF3923 family protein [Furfurilactobacillus rossiae]MCF6166812.1 DUF3923 family protein [Furfurilactobacillus rossiae]